MYGFLCTSASWPGFGTMLTRFSRNTAVRLGNERLDTRYTPHRRLSLVMAMLTMRPTYIFTPR